MSDPKMPPTAAQIAWLLQRRDLDVTRAHRHSVDGWTIWLGANGGTDDIVSDDLLETVPVEQTRWGVIVAEYADSTDKLRIERDELRAKLEELEQPEPYSGAKTKLLEIQHRKIAELEAERDDLKRQLAEARAVTVGDSWTPDNARFNELCDLANPELGPSIVADAPDYHPGAVVHCQCQYDPDE